MTPETLMTTATLGYLAGTVVTLIHERYRGWWGRVDRYFEDVYQAHQAVRK